MTISYKLETEHIRTKYVLIISPRFSRIVVNNRTTSNKVFEQFGKFTGMWMCVCVPLVSERENNEQIISRKPN